MQKAKEEVIIKTNELNDLIFKIINDNTNMKSKIKDLEERLYNSYYKLDKIKMITSDKEILEIIDGASK
jgi:hypothetical protein